MDKISGAHGMDPANETILLMGKVAFFVIVGFCATTAIATAILFL